MNNKPVIDFGNSFQNMSCKIEDCKTSVDLLKKEVMNNILKNVPKNMTNFRCPVCDCTLLIDYELETEIVFYCIECEKRIKAKKMPSELRGAKYNYGGF